MTTASSKGRHYAPPDPTLPRPWRALIDGSTGYVYFWNPETKVTQYERPVAVAADSPPPPQEEQQQQFSSPLKDDCIKGDGTVSGDNPPSSPVPLEEKPFSNEVDVMQPGHDHGKNDAPCSLEMVSSLVHSEPKPSDEHMTEKGDLTESNVPSSGDSSMLLQKPANDVLEANGDGVNQKSLQSSGLHANEEEEQSSVLHANEEQPSGLHANEEQQQQPSDLHANKTEQNSNVSNASSLSRSPKRTRYAPADPTLPKPWRALIDGNTGNMYFWNPETKVTQYERPQAPAPAPVISYSLKAEPISERQNYRHYDSVTNDQPDDSSNKLNQDASVGEDNVRNCSSPQVALSGELYRRKHEITVDGNVVLDPYMTFQSTGFPPEILKEVRGAGFSAPTPIQAQSWPFALKGRDIVAVAKTGSGKTLGYLIPGFILLKRVHTDSKGGPTVLILSPTRELATQIQDEAVKFGASSRISCTCLYGGAPKGPQLRDLDRGANIVVATPGRLNDILEMNRVNLSQVSYLVLDEADRMLDMGFEPQLRKIVKQIPSRRQTLMFTATWPKEVRRIAADWLVNPVQINIGNVDELVANKAITQHVEVIPPMEKNRRLEQILRSQDPGSKIIIFCSTKRMCDQLANNLNRKFGAAAIHGDKSQSERDKVLSQFRSGQSPVLVATDVAARGLDIKDVRVVINYDFPTGVEDYVHRIGRTGRAGASGVAYTFFSERDSKYASDLVKILSGANQCIPLQLKDMMSHGGYGCKSRQWSSGSGAVQSKTSFSSSPNESFHERFRGGKQEDHHNAGSDWGDSRRSRSPIRSSNGAKW